MPGRPPAAANRRTELFDDVVRMFLARGFVDVTLDDIAAHCGCSKSTLYKLGDSREQLIQAAVVHFFRQATENVEREVEVTTGARNRITAYLSAVGSALDVASDAFMADVDAYAPAREIYERNTRIAARRVSELIAEGVAAGDFRAVHAAFAADVAATMMVRIQQRQVRQQVGLDDASAYRELAAILTAGLRA